MTDQTETLWGYDEVAAYLNVAPSTVRRWAVERKLPVVKVGMLNKFRPEDVRAWVASNAEGTA